MRLPFDSKTIDICHKIDQSTIEILSLFLRTTVQSAERELEEEMGIRSTELTKLGSFLYQDERTRNWAHVYACTYEGYVLLFLIVCGVHVSLLPCQKKSPLTLFLFFP